MSGGILVFDVGGTQLRAGLYDASRDSLLRSERRATPSHRSLAEADTGASGEALQQTLAEAMHAMGRSLLGDAPPKAVSVAFPGPVDAAGRVLAAPTVWGDRAPGPVDFAALLARFWPGVDVALLNDVSAAGYRYLRGADEDLCIVTVSTGIGHKLFVGGDPVTGPAGRGGEFGHLRVDFSDDAPRCDCGDLGHLGALASGRASSFQVARLAAADPDAFRASDLAQRLGPQGPEQVDNEALAASFRAGDAFADRVIDAMAVPLGRVLGALHLAVGVERFIVVGGFALGLGDAYLQKLSSAAAASVWDRGADWSTLLEWGEDPNANLVGAGRYALRRADPQSPQKAGSA